MVRNGQRHKATHQLAEVSATPFSTFRPGYLSLSEAARWAGVSTKTLLRWIKKGLPRYQAGAKEKVLIRPVDIEAFLTRKQPASIDLNAMVAEVMGNLSSDRNGR